MRLLAFQLVSLRYVRRHALSRRENGTVATGQLGELDALVLELIDEQPVTGNSSGGSARRSTHIAGSSALTLEQQLRLFASQVVHPAFTNSHS